jgi:hypothetical protein
LNCSSLHYCAEGINLLLIYIEIKKCDYQKKRPTYTDCDIKFKNREEAFQKYIENLGNALITQQ